ncbi:telomeric repeat-binding factor 1 isoform X2 [Myripristis murdjan]|uniref:Telomeric repeat-binding factor n=1 Tax=Myripristis murdjan TaxID=586833 RepID=A0A668A3H1_9TELE|nr:telomeric repeat-binding factor 1 isoform X2 [Myripristis murdjan]
METETTDKSAEISSTAEKSVGFSQVKAVATAWMLDFSFVCLCRHFKDGELDEFNQILSAFRAIAESVSLRAHHVQKRNICAFLARVLHGKHLDMQYEEDDHVMPLMSAANIWPALRDTVADESLFNNIANLLLIQSVAVCLEKGQRSMASSALKWFEEKHDFPENIRVKLSTVVTQRDTYHPFLLSFSFSRLLETVQSFLDAYLEKNPSDYLLQAATEAAKSSEHREATDHLEPRDETLSETLNRTAEKSRKNRRETAQLRAKKKLLSTKITDVWKPESCKKPVVVLKRTNGIEIFRETTQPESSKKSVNASRISKPRKKWTYKLDKNLKDGVKRHGTGKWSLILQEYDFEGRTGTMLKDRWRVLVRAQKVS